MIFLKKHQDKSISTTIVSNLEDTVVDAEIVERLNEVINLIGIEVQPGEFNIATTWINEIDEDPCVAILVLDGGEMFAFYEDEGNKKRVAFLNISLGYKEVFTGDGKFSFIQQTPASRSVEWTGEKHFSYLRVGEDR